MWLSSLALLIVVVCAVRGDTPANCTYDDIVGEWIFYESQRNQDSFSDCSKIVTTDFNHEFHIKLDFPDIAVDSEGREGIWTLIYNQGIEVDINLRKYFAFSNWTNLPHHKVLSRCDELTVGYSHDVLIRDWSCFFGKKQQDKPMPKKIHKDRSLSRMEGNNEMLAKKSFVVNEKLIKEINSKQKSWKAAKYSMWNKLSHLDVLKMMGGHASRITSSPGTSTAEIYMEAGTLHKPSQFDWRTNGGMNYVSPVRNQGSCGSCYAFASMGMLEARYRIATNNSQKVVFSPQDVLNCSPYSQGCDGGFPYLIAGKYAEDKGVTSEYCTPYQPPKSACFDHGSKQECRRYYATHYRYVGGYYGGCNAELMMDALVRRGPIAVGIEVYDDFMHYKGGVYHHTQLTDTLNKLNKWNPLYLTNHAVLVVGYGTDRKTKEDYWIVKNSWGENWGEKGYFRIRRGNDEIGIESMAVEVNPIPTY